VWRLYLRTARRGFESGFIGLFQVLAQKPDGRPVVLRRDEGGPPLNRPGLRLAEPEA